MLKKWVAEGSFSSQRKQWGILMMALPSGTQLLGFINALASQLANHSPTVIVEGIPPLATRGTEGE
ncbi:hypothetical protein IVB33_18870 [Bradyrhizobium sp. 24]|nr:hypothetical protein [Bradyrhizobium sp. 24]